MIKDKKQLNIVILSSLLIAIFNVLPILWIVIGQGLDDPMINRRLGFLFYNLAGNFIISLILFHFNLSWKYSGIPWLNKLLSHWAVVIVLNIVIALLLGILLKEIGFFVPLRKMRFLGRYGSIINASTLVLIVMLISRLLELLMKNQLVAIENEKLKRENLQNQYNALKNQLDPHFLFNSLNTVMELIEEDKQLAKGFVAKLSDVFRYLLNHSDKQLLPLTEEIKFSENYVYLLKLRHSRLSVDFSLEEQYSQWLVPPLAIQLLLENAVKHNEISKSNPLTVTISQTGDQLEVVNQINQKIAGSHRDSVGMGLRNLSERYRILTGKDVYITREEGFFKVIIPLIQKGNHVSQDKPEK